MHCTITAESDGKRILTVSQHLAKLWAKVEWSCIFDPQLLLLFIIMVMRPEPLMQPVTDFSGGLEFNRGRTNFMLSVSETMDC